MISKPGKAAIAIAAILVVIVVSGCVSNPPINDGNGTKGKEVPVLKIGYLPITHALLPLIVYAEGNTTNFKLEMVRFSSWPDMAEAIQSGSIDGGGSILNTLAIKLASKDIPLKAVLMAVRDGSVLVVSKEIGEVSELKGKTIAIPSKFSPHYILLDQYLTDNNLELGTDVKTIELAPPDMISALAGKTIDGYIVAEPFGVKAEEMGIGRVLVLSKDIEIPGSHSNECVIAINQSFTSKYPEAVQEFVERLIKAGEFAEAHPEEAAKLVAPYLGQKPETIVHALTDPPGRSGYLDLYPRESEYGAFQDYMLKMGLLDKKIDIKEFVDESFAENAYKKLGEEITAK